MTAHPDEIPGDDAFVARLVKTQTPHWAHLRLRRIASTGTDNTIYRLGETLLVRVPRRPSAVALLSKELDWLPHLQGLPLDVPKLRFRGRAESGIAFDFGIFDWMEGQIAIPGHIADWQDAARAVFRDHLELDDSDWLRAKGWALYGAVIALSYYQGGRNEALCQQSRLTLSRLGLLV